LADPARKSFRNGKNPWLRKLSQIAAPKVGVVCFPYAGGGASVFYQWTKLLPPEIAVYAVQLPGREDRLAEHPIRNLSAVVDSLTASLSVLEGLPFAFFGHSMGALIAFETARELRKRGLATPNHLVVSGRQSPATKAAASPLYPLPEGAFVEECVRRYQGIPQAILNEPELMNLFLPVLRADMEVVETYRYQSQKPFDMPVTAMYGSEDRTLLRQDVESWSCETTGEFALHELPGGHFFFQTARAQVIAIVEGSALGSLKKRRTASGPSEFV